MPPVGYFIDANLFLLFVVGSVSQELIPKHRRLRTFTVEDYGTLLNLFNLGERVYVTPNTLTETSNLLAQHGEPERSRLFSGLRYIIQHSQEVVVASAAASSNSAFVRLGLTDAALLEVATSATPPITVDLDLYLEAQRQGHSTAVNFTHLQNL